MVVGLGGKSANVLLDDLDDEGFTAAVTDGVGTSFLNSGQTCSALTRSWCPAIAWPTPRGSPPPPRRSSWLTRSTRASSWDRWRRRRSGNGLRATSRRA